MAATVVGDKGRIILPAAIRLEAGVDVGEELIVRVAAPGQIVLETRDVVIGRLRSRFTGSGGTEDLRESRALDRAIDDQRPRPVPARGRDYAAEIRRGEDILAAFSGSTAPVPRARRRRDAG